MNILFTADWHIKLGQKNVPVDWQKARFTSMYEQFITAYKENNCDLLVIGGDVFDKLPNMAELEVYFEFLDVACAHNLKTIIYPGNHEALKKNTSFLSNLKGITKRSTNGLVVIIDDYYSDNFIDIVPYNRLKEFSEKPIEARNKILCTHVRGEIPPHVTPEVPLELFDSWSIVLAGDLHSYDNCQRNILYPGSPLTTSFHRSEVSTGAIVLDTETLEHEFVEFELPQLIRKTVSSKNEIVKTDYHHTIYELEGDATENIGKVDSELFDKKIVKKESKSSLQFNGSMSIKDELAIYLKQVMLLDDEKIAKIFSIYDDTVRES